MEIVVLLIYELGVLGTLHKRSGIFQQGMSLCLKFSSYMLCDSLIKCHLGETYMHPRYKGLGFPPSKSPRNLVMSIDSFQQTKPNI